MLSSKTITYDQLAKVIDHSLLRPELTEQEVLDGCKLAARYNTATVCVKPCHVALAKEALRDSDVKVSTVIGFPHGGSLTAIKVVEALAAMDQGAVELDMVLNIGQLRSGRTDYVQADIRAVCDVAHARNVKVKVCPALNVPETSSDGSIGATTSAGPLIPGADPGEVPPWKVTADTRAVALASTSRPLAGLPSLFGPAPPLPPRTKSLVRPVTSKFDEFATWMP